MTAEIVLQIFRFGFLLLLWLFIFAAFRVVRADLFGGRAGRVAAVPPRAAAAVGRLMGLDARRLQWALGYAGSNAGGTWVDAEVQVEIAPNTNADGSDNPEGRARNRRTELNVQN